MKEKCALVACIIYLSILSSGCSMVREGPGINPKGEPPCVGATFDLWRTREVVGPAEPFDREARRAALGAEPTTLDAIAAVAGWRGNWDRMIDVPENTTAEELNSWAGTTAICWEGFITRDIWADGTSEGVYLFMDGGIPVQVLWYTGPEKDFFITEENPVVHRHTVLIPEYNELTPVPTE
ncbi:hypothetical protein IU448_19030 [Nocardia flavorosea]|uniref:hypothetical protein n=1 Tax=Nocardia flavorosea TaxID=53429 RepID=UPI001894A842|nr:hypothetical protein [Nocardia flavorosea]MBF6351093.1 hypothetical protein [Nocardia flavorosea]